MSGYPKVELACDRCDERVLCDGRLTIRRPNGDIVPEKTPQGWAVVDFEKPRDLCPRCVEALKWFFARCDHHGASVSCLVRGCEKPLDGVRGLYCSFHEVNQS